MFTGWSDAAISALATIGYYEDVIDYDNSATEDVKLFMMPGVLHCFGGEGPSWVNWLEEIDNWVDKDQSLDQITVYYLGDDMRPSGSRLLCPYPLVSIYDGKGDTRDVSSFACGNQE